MECSGETVCYICGGESPPPTESGCACQGRFVHAECRVRSAQALVLQKNMDMSWWYTCEICNLRLNGDTRMQIAKTWYSQVQDRPLEDFERQHALWNIATCYQTQEQYLEAEEIFRSILAVREQALGHENANTMKIANSLAWCLTLKKEYAEAETIYEKELGFRILQDGIHSKSTLVCASAYASCLLVQEKFEKALCMLCECFNMPQPTSRPIEAKGHKSLVSDQCKDGKNQIWTNILGHFQKGLGEAHPSALKISQYIAAALEKEGQYQEAEDMMRQTLAITKRMQNTQIQSRHTIENFVAMDLAFFLGAQHRYQEQEMVLLGVLERRKKVLGIEHTDTLYTMNNLITCLGQQKKYSEQEEVLRQVSEIRKKSARS